MSQSVGNKNEEKCRQVAKVCYGLSRKWVGCCHDKRWAIITFWWKISTLALLANNRSILTFYSGDIVFQMKISVSSSASSSSIFDPAQVYQTPKLWTVLETLTFFHFIIIIFIRFKIYEKYFMLNLLLVIL